RTRGCRGAARRGRRAARAAAVGPLAQARSRCARGAARAVRRGGFREGGFHEGGFHGGGDAVRIAVTGASGFIGGAVATALADANHDVTGFGRTRRGWSHPLARYRVWDITSGPLLGDRDFDAVVHCAALADDWAPLPEAMRANRTGTRNVVASFRGARIVHLSTSSVYDAFIPTVQATEGAAPATRFLSSYAESKTFAELEVMGSDAVILRPHAVYGPGDTTLLPRVLAAVRHGRLVLPEGARVLHSLTHIDHLVDAVRLGLTGPQGVYNIADAEPVVLAEVIEEFLARRK